MADRVSSIECALIAQSACAHGVLKPNIIESHMSFTPFNCSSKPFEDNVLFNRIEYSIENNEIFSQLIDLILIFLWAAKNIFVD